MNYTKELKNDQIFVLAYGEDKLETQGHTNKDGTALCGRNDNWGRRGCDEQHKDRKKWKEWL